MHTIYSCSFHSHNLIILTLYFSWLSVNVPLYYGKVEAVVRPQVNKMVEVTTTMWVKLVDVTAPYREWLLVKLIAGWHWVGFY